MEDDIADDNYSECGGLQVLRGLQLEIFMF